MAPEARDEATPRARLRRVAPLALLLGAYALARVAVALAVPWQRAFDDFFYLPETQRWLAAGALGDDGVFRRVPLWNLLLGAHLAAFGLRAGIAVLQGWIVFAAVAFGVWAARRASDAPPDALALAPLALFLASPPVLLYGRQAVNEPFVGVLVMAMMALGARPTAGRAWAAGALAGAAAMTKLFAAASLVVPAAALVAARGALPLRVSLPRLLAGFAAVALPLAAFAMASRGSWLLDNTAAYNLGGLPLDAWTALPDPLARQAAGLAAWRAQLAGDPAGYAAAFAGRLAGWLARPASADLALFYRGYPMPWVEAFELVAAGVLLGLAALGTRRRDLGAWLFLAVVAVACSFPLHTPRSPKILLLYPAVMLAPAGLARLRRVAGRYIERR